MPPTLLFLALMISGTFFLGLYDVLTKKLLNRGFPENLLVSLTFLGSGLLLTPFALTKIPTIHPEFWGALLATVALNTISQLMWYKAFKYEEASLIAPLRLLSPPFVLISGYLILGEVATFWGALGVLTTVVGLLLLVQGETTFHHTSWQKLFKKPGILLGFFGAILFAISFSFDKKAVVNSSALFFAMLSYLAIGATTLIWFFISPGRTKITHLSKYLDRFYLSYIIVHTTGGLLTFAALQLTQAAYAASVKRLWSLWAVLLSGLLLREHNIGKKLLATGIMILGIALTLIGG